MRMRRLAPGEGRGCTASMQQVSEGGAGRVLQEQAPASCAHQCLHQRLERHMRILSLVLSQLLPGFNHYRNTHLPSSASPALGSQA